MVSRNYIMSNIFYHGTSEDNAKIIIGPPPKFDIYAGKGEPGKVIDTGPSLALAAIWAQTRFKEKAVVIEFDMPASIKVCWRNSPL